MVVVQVYSFDEICSLFPDHDTWSVCICGWDDRHDWSISHSKSPHSFYPVKHAHEETSRLAKKKMSEIMILHWPTWVEDRRPWDNRWLVPSGTYLQDGNCWVLGSSPDISGTDLTKRADAHIPGLFCPAAVPLASSWEAVLPIYRPILVLEEMVQRKKVKITRIVIWVLPAKHV